MNAHPSPSEPSALAKRNADILKPLLPPSSTAAWKEVVSVSGSVTFYYETLWRYMDIDCLFDGTVIAGFIDWKTSISHVIPFDMNANIVEQMTALKLLFEKGHR